jgi:hypothetical protein
LGDWAAAAAADGANEWRFQVGGAVAQGEAEKGFFFSLDSPLLFSLFRLTLNSFYGYCSLRSNLYSKSAVMTEDSIAANTVKMAAAQQVTLLGAVESSDPEKPPTLLYVLTWNKRDDKIENISQVSANILSDSRLIFLSLNLKLLQALDPKKAEVRINEKGFSLLCSVSADDVSGHGFVHHLP